MLIFAILACHYGDWSMIAVMTRISGVLSGRIDKE